MFEEKVAAVAEQQSSCMDFIDLFVKFRADVEKFADIRTPEERIRMRKFEARVDAAWLALLQEERDLVAENLIHKGLLPAEVKDIMRVFQAKVVSIR
jgi:hypothetical protein